MKREMKLAAMLTVFALAGCSGDKGPTNQDAVKAVEAYFTQQGKEATLQRTWRFEVTDAGGLSLKCEKKPNGDHACDVSGTITALGHLAGRPTSRPQGEGWQPVDVKDEGTSAG